jgi:sec-independent protein translocase protein TatA
MNLGPAEILVILIVALIVFGPKKLPEVGRQVGSAVRELRRMQDSVRSELDSVLHHEPQSTPVESTATHVVDEPDHTQLPAPPAPPDPDDGFAGPSGSFS